MSRVKTNKYNDWMCQICNVNIFGSKNECLKCKSKKPQNLNNNLQTNPIVNLYNEIKQNIYEEIKINKINENNNKIQRAIDEGLPRLYYVSNCSICKNQHNPKQHNCWKYS